MNAYNLLYPDGSPSPVWVCGNCDSIAAQTDTIYRAKKFGVDDDNPIHGRGRAEACCICTICSKPLSSDEGRRRSDHDECSDRVAAEWRAKQPQPKPCRPVTPLARALESYMSDISERCWAAGWMCGLEHSLWEAVQEGPRDYGQWTITAEDVGTLRELANAAGGWICWEHETDEFDESCGLLRFDDPAFEERMGSRPGSWAILPAANAPSQPGGSQQ